MRVLYLFAGPRRRAELGTALQEIGAGRGINVLMEEHDILRGEKSDLAHSKKEQVRLDRIANGDFDVVITSPPCDTFTRAVYTNRRGPKPVRSYRHPKGFPWLQGVSKERPRSAQGVPPGFLA